MCCCRGALCVLCWVAFVLYLEDRALVLPSPSPSLLAPPHFSLFLSCLVLYCISLSYLVLSCLFLPCLVLSCHVLSCLILSCLGIVLSCRGLGLFAYFPFILSFTFCLFCFVSFALIFFFSTHSPPPPYTFSKIAKPSPFFYY